jgi:hypothetical protein
MFYIEEKVRLKVSVRRVESYPVPGSVLTHLVTIPKGVVCLVVHVALTTTNAM